MRAAKYARCDAGEPAAEYDGEPRVDGSARHGGLPIGTKLTLDLADGARVTGNILSVEQDAVVMQPRTRLPSPAKRVPFDLIVAIVPDSSGGVDTGKAVAIGAAAGAVSFVAIFLILWGLGD